MSRQPHPSSPLEDLSSWQGQRGALAEGALLTPDLIALAQSGVAVIFGTRRADGRPLTGLGAGCRVRPDGTMRVLAGREANAELLEAVAAGAPLAVTFTGAPDHRAFQVKASRARIVPALSDDRPEVDRQAALLRDGLVEIGFSSDLAAGFVDVDAEGLVAIELRPERIFTQTPGPGAGAELTR